MNVSRTWRTRRVDIDHDRGGAKAALKRSHGTEKRGQVHNRVMRMLKSGWQKREARRFREDQPAITYAWTVGRIHHFPKG